jgi:hypothetical protein
MSFIRHEQGLIMTQFSCSSSGKRLPGPGLQVVTPLSDLSSWYESAIQALSPAEAVFFAHTAIALYA